MATVTVDEAPARGTARWSRLASLGLILGAIGPLLMLGAGAVWGLELGDEVGFFSIAAAVALLGAFMVRRSSTLGKVIGLIASLLLGFFLWWTVFGLFTLNSFFDFAPGLLVFPGILMGLIGSIAALRAHRRGDFVAEPQGAEARWLRVWPTIVIVLALVSAGMTFLSKDTVEADASVDLTVKMFDFEFDQEEYPVDGGGTVLVRNDDPFLHTFTVRDLDIDVVLTPGSEVLVEIPAEPGDYIVFCLPHSDEDPQELDPDDMSARFQVN